MLVATVTGTTLTFENNGNDVTDATKYLTVKFDLEEAWSSRTKTAVFKWNNPDNTDEEQIAILMAETSNYYLGNNMVTVPWEVIKVPSFTFWLYGIDENGVRTTTTVCTVEVKDTGFSTGSSEPNPTPNVYQQIVTMFRTNQQWYNTLYEEFKVAQDFDENSVRPISGKGVASGMESRLGEVEGVLATVLEGSTAIPKTIVNTLVSKAESEHLTKMESALINKIGSRLGLGTVSTVSFKPAGYENLQPNNVYILVTPDGSGTINVYDHETGDPVQITGKVLAVICGNYGNIAPELNHALVGIITSSGFQQNIYTVQGTNASGESIQGTISWEGTAMMAVLTNTENTTTN